MLGETCILARGCAPTYLAAVANDWTHGNSLSETPDGAFLYSVRHQDWLIKIDYPSGEGSGEFGVWGRMAISRRLDDPFPWFSHQHDAEVEVGRTSTISVFDNGNTRWVADREHQHSRGQVIEIDESNRTAHLAWNVDLGIFSLALGTAQRLANGDYHFDAGFEAAPEAPFGGVGYALEVDPAGDIVSSIKMQALIYRSFRLPDLYGPVDAPEQAGTRAVGFRE